MPTSLFSILLCELCESEAFIYLASYYIPLTENDPGFQCECTNLCSGTFSISLCCLFWILIWNLLFPHSYLEKNINLYQESGHPAHVVAGNWGVGLDFELSLLGQCSPRWSSSTICFIIAQGSSRKHISQVYTW